MALQTQDISQSVTLGGNTLTYTLRIAELRKNILTKTTQCRIDAILQQSKTGVCFENKQAGVSCVVNGKSLFSDYKIRTLSGNQAEILYTWEGELQHDGNGDLLLNISGAFWLSNPTATQPKRINVQGVMSLIPIGINCSVGASDAFIGSNTTIVVANEPQWTHSVAFRFGTLEGYLGADGQIYEMEKKFEQSVISFPIPESFYSQIPDRASHKCRLQVKVYYQGAQRGEVMTEFTVTADPRLCSPLLTGQVTDQNPLTLTLTGDDNRLVRFFSQAMCSLTAEGQQGATIETMTLNGQPFEDNLVLEGVETGTFRFSATDSRGYTTTLTVEKELVDYIRLTCNPVARRTAPTTGQVELLLQGQYFGGAFGQQDNSLQLRCRVAGGDWQTVPCNLTEVGYQGSLLLEGLDYTYAHAIEVEAQDCLDKVCATAVVSRGIPVFSWGEDSFRFHVPVILEAGWQELT